MHRNFVPAFFLGVSLFGLGTVMAMILYPPSATENFLWRKPLVGSILGLICVLGVFAVLFPRACSRKVSCGGEQHAPRANFINPKRKPTLRGHHPDCEKFSTHVFQIDGRTLCAGCTGLFLGGLMALVGTLAYFFGNLYVGQTGFVISWIGAAGVFFGLLLLPLFNILLSSVRLFLNAFFAFGSFLILVGADEIAQSTFVDLFLVVLIVFWIFTRIVLSRWNHERICRSCEVKACEFRKL
jgi:hypothetical protein